MIYFHDIDPIALSLGPIKVHWYGIMYLLGFTAAWLLGRAANQAADKGIGPPSTQRAGPVDVTRGD